MARKELTLDDILKHIEDLEYKDFRKVLNRYTEKTGIDFKNDTDRRNIYQRSPERQ